MKKRIFYVINLDKQRIVTLAIVFTGLLLIAFATGYRMARSSQAVADSEQSRAEEQDSPPPSEDSEQTLAALESNDRAGGSNQKHAQGGTGPGIPLTAFSNSSSDKTDSRGKDHEETESRHAEQAPSNPRAAVIDTAESIRLSNVHESPSRQEPKADKESQPDNDRQTYYTFQMGAFSSSSKANELVNRLKEDGFHPFVQKTSGKYNVRVGRSSSRRDLWSLEHELKDQDYNFFLVKSE